MTCSPEQPLGWSSIADYLTALDNFQPSLDDSAKMKLLLTLLQELARTQGWNTTFLGEKFKWPQPPVPPPYFPDYSGYWISPYPVITSEENLSGHFTCTSEFLDFLRNYDYSSSSSDTPTDGTES